MTDRIYEPVTTGEPMNPRLHPGRHSKDNRWLYHLDVLEDWNEVRWEPRDIHISHTSLCTIVTCNAEVFEYMGIGPEGQTFRHVDYDTVVALYADDDFLFRIVCFSNDRTHIVFESDCAMRA